MADKPVDAVFFTELDAILDTRMGTLMRIDPKAIPEIIKGGYLARDRDAFIGVDPIKFAEMYAARNQRTLSLSYQTPVMWFMRDFGRSVYEQNINTPFLRDPRIVINTHPYKLTQEEKDLIVVGIKHKTKHIDRIEMVDIDYKDLTPAYFKKHLHVVWLYEPVTWLETQSSIGNLNKDTCPGVEMFGPLLIKNLSDKTTKLAEYHQAAETLAKYFVGLHLVGPHVFSADIMARKSDVKSKEETPA